jgi:hypothetical protein
MWKNVDSSGSIPLNSHSNSISSESVSEMLMSAIRDSSVSKEQVVPNPKPELAQSQEQLVNPMLREYAEALDKCTRSGNEFIRCASVLSDAREAYEKLRTLSSEIRRVLASDEAKVSALMEQVQKIVDTQMSDESAQSASERRPPEPSKLATLSVTNGERSKMIKFP